MSKVQLKKRLIDNFIFSILHTSSDLIIIDTFGGAFLQFLRKCLLWLVRLAN